MIQEITVTELQTQLASDNKPYLLDVREDVEVAQAKLAFDKHISVGDLVDEYETLPKDRTIVVYCRSGARSQRAIEFLKDRGFDHEKLINLKGGIHAWADHIDPSMAKP